MSLTDVGARCDARSNDRPALARALSQLGTTGGTVLLPAGRTCVVLPEGDGATLELPTGTTIRGEGEGARLLLRDGPGRPPTGLFSVEGNDVELHRLELVSQTEAPSTLLTLRGGERTRLFGVTLRSQPRGEGGGENHGLRLTGPGPIRSLRIEESTLTDLDYALYLSNQDRLEVSGLAIERTTFARNRADDIELNAPSARLFDVSIAGCTFRDNRYGSPQAAAGFGIGLANAADVRITNNSFTRYQFSPVHIEDRSRNVRLERNSFTQAATGTGSQGLVTILSGSSGVELVGNRFDLRAHRRATPAVLVTSGAPAAPEPRGVTLRENHYLLGSHGLEVTNATQTPALRAGERVSR
ncbi:right-handed parallel beta-helix repeat-containing protein [Luteococcus sp. H101]|uniref:right-handed parallel beta-helix repeat-containing protein n=1 Tax=Luteococcus sp. H101 TaxID=3139402 RepID=UPI00313AE791